MRTFAFPFVALLFLACDRQPTAPTTHALLPPTFEFDNGPPAPGQGFVVRFNESFYLTTVDVSQDLVVRHYNAEDITFCGGATPLPLMEEQWILGPPGTEVLFTMFRDEPVYVYRYSEVPPQAVTPQFCADLVSKWIYRGVHSSLHIDSDFSLNGLRSNTIRAAFFGQVFDRAGQRYGYWESFHVVYHPARENRPPDHPNDLDMYKLVIR